MMRSGQLFYEAAKKGDLERVVAWQEEGLRACHEWDVNPIRGVIEGTGRWRIAELLLRDQEAGLLLLQARCPDSGNTLLHLAASLAGKEKLHLAASPAGKEKLHPAASPASGDTLLHLAASPEKLEKLAILLIKSFADGPPRQRFLEAVNRAGQTALHVATQNLLTSVVEEFTLQTQLKINLKDNIGQTSFDVIMKKCHECTLKDDWKTPWRISIMLRSAQAKPAHQLNPYEDEEDTIKELIAIESLISNNKTWSKTVNIILIVSTLALTLVFAAIFTIPQILSPPGGGDNTQSSHSTTVTIQDTLSHNKSFGVFICFLTLACVLMYCVISSILVMVTLNHEIRALILLFSWGCISIMGFSLSGAYIIAVYIYMGYQFTWILTMGGAIIVAFNILLAIYFDLGKAFWNTISTLFSMTLLHGFFVTILQSFLPKT